MQLDEKQKQFYSAMESMFTAPGWELLRQGWQNEADGLADAVFHNAKSMDDVYAGRVRYQLLIELTMLPKTIAAQRNAIENDELDDFTYE